MMKTKEKKKKIGTQAVSKIVVVGERSPMSATPSPVTFTARCLCGEFAHEMTGAPIACVVCHCTTCRSYSGAPYLHTAAWTTGSVKRTAGADENLLVHKHDGNEAFQRMSCRLCGSYVAGFAPPHSMFGFQLGTIDGAYENNTYKATFKPNCHLFYGSRVVDVVDGAPKFAKKGPQDGVLPETRATTN